MKLRSLLQWVVPPVFPADEEKTRMARTLYISLELIWLLLWVAFPIFILTARTPTQLISSLLIDGSLLLLLPVFLWLTRLGQIRLVGVLCSTFIYLSVLYFNLFFQNTILGSGGTLMVAIVVAGQLMGERGVWVFGCLGVLSQLGKSLAAAYGWQMPPMPTLQLIDETVVSVSQILFFSLMLGVFMRSLAAAVRRADEKNEALMAEIAERQQIDETLQRHSQVLLSMAEGVNFVDQYGLIRFTNPAFDTMFGYAPGELIGQPIALLNALSPADNDQLVSRIVQSLSQGQTFMGEFHNRRKDGSTFYTFAHISPLAQPDGIWAVSVQEDVTGQKQTQDALRVSEERLQQAMHVGHIGFFDHDLRKDAMYWSPEARETFGFGADEHFTLPDLLRYTHPDDRARFQALVHQAQDPAGEGLLDIEYRFVRRDGEIRWIVARSKTFFDGEGVNRRPIRTLGTGLDITARKQIEEELRQSEERYRLLAKNLPNSALMLFDQNLRFVLADGPELEQTGYSRAMLEGKQLYEALPNEFAQLVEPNMRRVLAGERFKMTLPYGDAFYEYNYVPFVDEQGTVATAMILATNVTDRVRALEALQTSEARLALIFNNTSDMQLLLAVNDAGQLRIEAVNQRYLEVAQAFGLNLTAADVIGQDRAIFLQHLGFADDLVAFETSQFQAVLAHGQPVEYEMILPAPSGGKFYAAVTLVPVLHTSTQGTHVLWSARDITSRKQAEASLNRLTAQQEWLLKASQTIFASLAEEDILNTLLEYLRSALACDVCNFVWQDDALADAQPYNFFAAPGNSRFQRTLHPNLSLEAGIMGDVLRRGQAEMVNHAHHDPRSVYPPDMQVEREHLLAIPFQMKNVRRGIALIARLRDPLFTPNEFALAQGLVGQAVMALDNARLYQAGQHEIQERKRAEHQLQASLREKEILLREIHHRVKNNLQVISSLLYLQSQRIADAGLLELFRESQNRVATMALIHEQLYQSDNFAQVDFGAYVQTLLAALFESYGIKSERIHLVIDAPAVALTVNAAIPCGLLINEIVSNALKYAFPNGRIGQITLTMHMVSDHYDLILGDDGVGITGEAETPHPRSLGLRLIHRLVGQLGGSLTRAGPPGVQYHIQFPNTDLPRG